ncbi:hypothetical protein CYMTET_33835 [Cymbomonas tetramitiformis]|uniref:Glutamine cyclotransferase n=1 Tax=Cymbomonas tetramitiformis TaxID=36881 RepID=A0AAE0FC71_9CHLO|nr:hypothetical protein CYMTET_33835 [Cymbomonas tetramitiformis]
MDECPFNSVLQQEDGPALYTYTVVNSYPHDPDAFTQGLLYYSNDTFYESAGLYGESTLRHVDLVTGNVLKRVGNEPRDFAEGLALSQDRLVQLTWRSPKGILYDRESFEVIESFRTQLKDGWGLTNEHEDSHELIATDSGSKLFYLDAETFETKRTVQVTDNGVPVPWLNELEWIDGEIWANIWQTECIARINPETGEVNGWILMHGLRQSLMERRIPQRKSMDVLNGIAWDPHRRRLFLTGKLWPRLYEVQVRRITWPPDINLAEARRLCIKRK